MSVYDEIRAERAVQNEKWGGHEHDDSHHRLHWLGYIKEHAARGKDVSAFRQQMIRVAALAVAAVEAHDRKTGSG